MPRLPDLVRDSRLDTEFRDSITIHSYREIDEIGGRFSRKEQWKWERYLGGGGFGQVKLQRCISKVAKPDSIRAVKIMDKKSLDYHRELEAITKFSNDRYKRWFVKSFGWFEDPTSIFITMEYCRHGDLHHYLEEKRFLPPIEVQQLACQIVEGLDQMHQNDFAHRDLKPGNILIKSKPPERWWIVLADFGITKRADVSNGPTTAIKGTNTFMAPELLGYLEQIRPKSIADFKAADMWALGEVVFQMLVGEATFQNPVEIMRYCTGQREFPSHRLPISAADDGCEFVTRLMIALPQDRITTTQCIRHRWIQSLVEDELSALSLEYNKPLTPEISQKKPASASASAQWSDLSNPEHSPTQTTAQWRLDTAVHIRDSTAGPTQFQSTSSGIPIQHNQYPNNQESLALAEIKLEQTLVGHSGYVYEVVFSPDGEWLASASEDKTVRLWDARSGKLVITFEGFSHPAEQMAFSPDSKRLVFVVHETLSLWDVRSEELVKTIKGFPIMTRNLAFSPDSKRLAAAADSFKEIWLWDARSGELVKTLCHTTFTSSSVFPPRMSSVFSPDSRWLASCSSRVSSIRLWDASSGELVKEFDNHSDDSHGMMSIAFSPDSKRLAAGCEKRIIVYEWSQLNGIGDYTSGPENGRVELWDLRSGELMQTLLTKGTTVNQVVFSPCGERLVSAGAYGEDGTSQLWDTWSGERVKMLGGYTDTVNHFVFSSDGKRLAANAPLMRDRDTLETVWLWDAMSGELVKKLEGHSTNVGMFAFSPDCMQLAACSWPDRMVRLWDARSGELVQMFKDYSGTEKTYCPPFAFSPDSKRLAIGRADGTMQLRLAKC